MVKKIFWIILILVLTILVFKTPKKQTTTITNANILYFAYGSNMNLEQMKSRCQNNWSKISNGILKNYEFGFDKSGYANIKETQDKEVIGVLYSLTQPCLDSLDGYEGYPNHYNRKTVSITGLENKITYQAWIYIQPKENFNGIANKPYLDTIITGGKENNLPKDWIKYLNTFK